MRVTAYGGLELLFLAASPSRSRSQCAPLGSGIGALGGASAAAIGLPLRSSVLYLIGLRGPGRDGHGSILSPSGSLLRRQSARA